MDTRKLADEIAKAIEAQGMAIHLNHDGGPWVPYFDTDPICVIGDSSWPVGVVVTMWEENQRGERRYIGTRIYQPPKEV